MTEQLIFAGTTYTLAADGRSLIKANVGQRKQVNGKTYVLNQNSRWEREDRGTGAPAQSAPVPVQSAQSARSPAQSAQQSSGKKLRQRVAHAAVHEGDLLAENIVSWKAGKIVGGAIAQFAIAHGANPVSTQIISETVVQAGTATALHAIKLKNLKGKAEPRDVAAYFVRQVAAAYLGKYAHHGTEWAVDNLGLEQMQRAIAPLIAGKLTGLSTVTGMGRYHLDSRVVDVVIDKAKADIHLMDVLIGRLTGGKLRLAKSVGLDEQTQALVWALTQAGIVLALQESRG